MPQEWNCWQGQTINNRFELQEYLGASQDSAVFLTTLDPAKSQKAAIKLVAWDEENAKLQLSRWDSIKDLSHPHIIRLFESGECSLGNKRLLYVVMEYADENLSSLLPARPLTPVEAREMLDPTLDALAYIHEHGFVHGHIRPSNIMAVGERLKLSSDGISKPIDDSQEAGGGLSTAADIWSLGATLVEALTQLRPVLHSDTEKDAVLSELPVPFRNIAEQCLRADPQQRCTIADIQTELALASLFAGEPAASEAKSSPGRRRFAGPTAAVVVLAAILGGIFLFKHQHPPAEPSGRTNQAEISSLPTAPAETKVVASSAVTRPAAAYGKVVRRVLPDVSQNSLRTINGTIRVKLRVYVDPAGTVEKVRVESEGPSRYFASKASEAAKQWKFDSPVANEKSVPSEWDLEFQFKRTSSKVREVQILR
jgi:TonB family protein